MSNAADLKICIARRRVYKVDSSILNNKEHEALAPRRICTYTTQNNNAIYALGLAVGLRMIGCGNIYTGTKHLEDGLPNLTRK